MEPFLGQILLIPWDWAPKGWMLCNGQLLAIQQYSALYSLIGITYGGNGTTTFALPDLRGRAPIHQGNGPGLTNRVIGESAGTEQVTLLTSNIPAHSHPIVFSAGLAGRSGTFLATEGATNTGPNSLVMDPSTIMPTGGGTAHNNMQPYLVMNYIIAMEGIYPSRP